MNNAEPEVSSAKETAGVFFTEYGRGRYKWLSRGGRQAPNIGGNGVCTAHSGSWRKGERVTFPEGIQENN